MPHRETWAAQDYIRFRQEKPPHSRKKVGRDCLLEIQSNILAARGAQVPHTVTDFLPLAPKCIITTVGASTSVGAQREQRNATPLARALCERGGK